MRIGTGRGAAVVSKSVLFLIVLGLVYEMKGDGKRLFVETIDLLRKVI